MYSSYSICVTRGPHDSLQELETFISVQFIMRIIQAQISIKPSHFLWAQRWTLQLAGGLHEQIRCSEWLYWINKLQKSVSEKYSPSTHEIDADFPRNWELTTKFLSEVLTLLPKISGSTNEQTGTHDHSSFTSRQSGLAQDYCYHEEGNLQQGHSSKQLGIITVPMQLHV